MSALDTEILKIDTQFPVNGKDNSSQGFRSNFAYVKNSLEYASANINNLQLLIPDSLPIVIHNATPIIPISILDTAYNVININSDIPVVSIVISGSKSGVWCKTRLHIENVSTISSTIAITGTYLPAGNSTIHSNITGSLVLPINTSVILECWTIDNGIEYYINSFGFFSEVI
jgi:hypothetical protein